jgi:hypothetical protein
MKMSPEPLDQIKNKIQKEPYGLHSSYFENLPVRISERVSSASATTKLGFNTWMSWVSLAASLVFIAFLWFQPFTGTEDNNIQNLENQVYWSLYSSDVSIDEFFYMESFDHDIMDQLIMDETKSFAFEEEYGYDPNWDF